MMVKFITLLTYGFDINRDLLIKDLIKFEVFGSKISSVNNSTMYGRVTYTFHSAKQYAPLFEAWGGGQNNIMINCMYVYLF